MWQADPYRKPSVTLNIRNDPTLNQKSFSYLDLIGQPPSDFSIAGRFYPGTDAGVKQVASGIYAGTGIPSNTNGNNGDYYFRSDGGVGTHIYFKTGGTWTGIV